MTEKVGVGVNCTVCLKRKQPTGRSVPNAAAYCNFECAGYYEEPKPGCLWPGEKEL